MKVDTHGSKEEEWIGFDLDGTLAKYDGWKGIEHIGEPVDTMVIIAKMLHRIGKKIKVLTARVAPRDDGEGGDKAKKYVEAWCKKNLGFVPEITYEKDASMAALFDDRAVAVEQNTGKVLGGWPDFLPKASDKAKKAVLGKTEKKAEEDQVAPNKWPEYKVWMKEHKDKSVEKVRDIIRAYYRQLGDWGVKNSKGRIVGDKEIIRRNGDLDDIVIRGADEVSRSKRVNCHEMAARILDLLKKNGIVARRVMLDPENIGGVNMGHSTVFFKDNGGRWHRATGGMKAGKKSRLGDFDSIDDAVRQYIALGRKNGEFPAKDDINVFDTTDSEFSDSMSWPDYLAVARNGKKLYPVKDRHEKIAASRPSKEDLWRMYDIMQADAKLSGKVSGLGFGRNGDALRRAAIKLKVKELANVVKDGRRIRNRIAHTPGYVPSEQDAGRALRQYAAADRKISEIISK